MIGIIIQARLNSSRLPAKIMLKLPTGRSVLEEVVFNCEKTGFKTLVASDTDLFGIADFIGDKDDVWTRYIQCAMENNIDIIVRITSDCPMIIPEAIRDAVGKYMASDSEYIFNHNDHEPSSGDGYDVEVFSLEDLIRYGKAKEHVTSNLRKHATRLKITPPNGTAVSVNTIEDYIKVYRMLQ
ncbi:MAG: hypothetical protein KAS32_17045 [Candidatus Peribacteraceae bacterium]|nr:hypothetical protein [Candidatus Peribacteraceae bacterium]